MLPYTQNFVLSWSHSSKKVSYMLIIYSIKILLIILVSCFDTWNQDAEDAENFIAFDMKISDWVLVFNFESFWLAEKDCKNAWAIAKLYSFLH